MNEFKLDLPQIKQELVQGIAACAQRGLKHSAKWLSELYYALSYVKTEFVEPPTYKQDCEDELEIYFMAKSYFDLKEYDRCAHFTKNCTQPKTKFLYFYSKFFSIEKKKLDSMTDTNCPPDPTDNADLNDLYTELKRDFSLNKLDGFCLYVYGIVLKKMDLIPLASTMFAKAINSEPVLWCAWYELGKILTDKDQIFSFSLPDHWMKHFFLPHAYLEQLNNNEALQIYLDLYAQGLKNSTYLMAQIALGHHNKRDLMQAIELFKQILAIDPYRLDNLDTYSNLLYVMEMKIELADLAHKVVLIDKYRVETCCVIGNFYSLRSDHAKAVLYFRRALKLNPQFLSAWTLMGHEYMEMKNTNAAISSYRHAIEINNRDYRAWYGLGQTYEILKMYSYSLYYYKQAQQLKPNDSRMIIALAEIYERLDKTEYALKCYYKACTIGDQEGQALVKLAKLYDKLKEFDNAAAAFTEYCLKEENNKARFNEQETEFYSAVQYLANYHLKKGQLAEAYTYAYKCLENEKTKEMGKSLLKDIAARRKELDTDVNTEGVLMDETGANLELSDMPEVNSEVLPMDETGGNLGNLELSDMPDVEGNMDLTNASEF